MSTTSESEALFQVVFVGIQPEQTQEAVVEGLVSQFKLSEQRAAQLVEANRWVVKTQLSQAQAERYQAKFHSLGAEALVEPMSAAASKTAQSQHEQPQSEPPQSELPKPETSSPTPSAQGQPSEQSKQPMKLRLAPTGSRLGPPGASHAPIQPPEDMAMDPAGVDLVEAPPEIDRMSELDLDQFVLAETGADLSDKPSSEPPPPPSTDHLSLQDPQGRSRGDG